MCNARTLLVTIEGYKVVKKCDQSNTLNSDYCYYHDKMSKGITKPAEGIGIAQPTLVYDRDTGDALWEATR